MSRTRSAISLRTRAVGLMLVAVVSHLVAFAPIASAAGCSTGHGSPYRAGTLVQGFGYIECDDERLVSVLVCVTDENRAPIGPCGADQGNGYASATGTAALCSAPRSLYGIAVIAADEFGTVYQDFTPVPTLYLCPR